MATAVIMPQIGQDIETGKIVEWLKSENEPVKKGDIVATVESDKANFDVEAQESGVLLRRLYKAGDEAKVFEPIAYIGSEGEAVTEPKAEVKVKAEVEEEQRGHEKVSENGQALGNEKVAASPAARRIAEEQGIDLSCLKGSGPNGRIIKRDVAKAAPLEFRETAAMEVPTAAQASVVQATVLDGDETVPFSRMRQRVAQRLVLSKQTIPHFYLFTDFDMSVALAWRKAFCSAHGARISVTDMIVKATAQVLTRFPKLNAHVEHDRIIVKRNINIGIAVAVEDGLLVPAIAQADKKSLLDLSERIQKAAQAAKRGSVDTRITGTFTVSNLGMFDITRFVPIINPPEGAILGVGATQKRVVPVGGNIGVRDMMTVCLSCDHRAVDGAYAAGFLKELKRYLEEFGN